jgi:ATP-binding cassette subfamily C protein CydCD
VLRQEMLARAMAAGGSPGGKRSGELVTLATRGLDALDGYFGRYLPQLGMAAVIPVLVVAVLLPTDLVAGVTVLLTVPLIVVFMALVGRAAEARRTRRWRALARLSHHFLDVVAGLPTLKVFGRSRAQLESLARITDDYRRETMGALRVAFLSAFVLELVATLSVALVAVGIGLRLVDGAMDLRTGLFILVLAPEAYLPLRHLGMQFHASEEGLAAADSALAVIEEPMPPAGHRTDLPDLRAGAVLAVEGVSVRQPGRDVLAPFEASFAVRGGEVVLLRGESGAGKTTLLEVLMGLRTPADGTVRLSDADLVDLAPGSWHAQIAYVAQVPYLFPGTVGENVALGAPDAPHASLRAALDVVGLEAVDLDQRLGEGGAGLSVGQRRRVGIARALVRDAPLLLLDEPTAGLDEAAEEAVLRHVLNAARTNRQAVVLVGHRAAAAELADRVVDIEWRADPASGAGMEPAA